MDLLDSINLFLTKQRAFTAPVQPRTVATNLHGHWGIKGPHDPNIVHKDPKVRHHPGKGSIESKVEIPKLEQLLDIIQDPKDKQTLKGFLAFRKKYGFLTDKQWRALKGLAKKYGIKNIKPDTRILPESEARRVLANNKPALGNKPVKPALRIGKKPTILSAFSKKPIPLRQDSVSRPNDSQDWNIKNLRHSQQLDAAQASSGNTFLVELSVTLA